MKQKVYGRKKEQQLNREQIMSEQLLIFPSGIVMFQAILLRLK